MSSQTPQSDRRIATQPPTYDYWDRSDFQVVLRENDGNVAAVARHYQIAYSTARRWQNRHGLTDTNGGGGA